ncbi:type VI secretion system-associated protein TagF [Paraburkholderia solisilvae]|uniref:Type VI secretion-associated protein TagF n=1 Tax=Paraburkholderia solisilvae TaxID=624376 RepID=A0A6J5EXU2_9BURK|nr:type VI secretion system-associated protein TagF [Paraburkholderia solisilvae]CAB3770062.1 hypothetical protein LMG29739_05696 [Paraburkholderia solisilvae]
MSGAVGFYGKLAMAGDFVQRRLPSGFVEAWDRHFQRAVEAGRRELGERWSAVYRRGGIWRFMLSAGVCGEGAWCGVIAPAEDRLGREFPMVLAAPCAGHAAHMAGNGAWFDALEQGYCVACAEAPDVVAFDAHIAALPAPFEPDADPAACWNRLDWEGGQWRLTSSACTGMLLGEAWRQAAARSGGWCLWWTQDVGRLLATRGLPDSYAALLDADADAVHDDAPRAQPTVDRAVQSRGAARAGLASTAEAAVLANSGAGHAEAGARRHDEGQAVRRDGGYAARAAQGYVEGDAVRAVQDYVEGRDVRAAQDYAEGRDVRAAQDYAEGRDVRAAQDYVEGRDVRAAQGYAEGRDVRAAQGYTEGGDLRAAQDYTEGHDMHAAQGYTEGGDLRAAQDYTEGHDMHAAQDDAEGDALRAAQGYGEDHSMRTAQEQMEGRAVHTAHDDMQHHAQRPAVRHAASRASAHPHDVAIPASAADPSTDLSTDLADAALLDLDHGRTLLLSADDGLPDPRRRAARSIRAAALASAPDLASLQANLLALHPSLLASSQGPIAPSPEDGAALAVRFDAGRIHLLRIGAAAAWHWRHGQLRPLFVERAAGVGGEFDDLLFGAAWLAMPGLGSAAGPQCDEAGGAFEPGDRLLLLVTRALTQLPHAIFAQALALPACADARIHIATCAGLGAAHAQWPLAVIEEGA